MPETADDLTRAPRKRGPAKASTPETRLKRRDLMRRLRAQRAYEKRWSGWTFDEICAALKIVPSPQSCLNPAYWNDCVMYDGLDLKHQKKT